MNLPQPPGHELSFLPFGLLKATRTLQFFQVPLVVELKDEDDGATFIASWHDCSDNVDRWLYLPCQGRSIEQYTSGSLSLYALFTASRVTYVVDIISGKPAKVWVASPSQLQDGGYLPDPDKHIGVPVDKYTQKPVRRTK